ncbi:MAG: hypothetical protein HYX72_07685 [Acidobacteria bacterium]|nr:hypothetical protein [Acidobacteriota bacterium]
MRTLAGQATLLARTVHDIAVDNLHDEIVVPNPFAQAILFFRREAHGEELPIRVIQGPKTMLGYSDVLDVDPVHNEVIIPQSFSDAVFVFRRDVGGDVAPIRVIHGPKTRLDRPEAVAVDPVNNLIAVMTRQGVMVFNRTDSGDVAPRWVITGPKTGVSGAGTIRRIVLYPEGKKIFATGGVRGDYLDVENRGAFLGVWKYGDQGDIPPWGVLKGVSSVALNPEAKEVIGGGSRGVNAYHVPELFE